MAHSNEDESQFGKEFDLIHRVIIIGRKVGADHEFWKILSENGKLFAQVVSLVSTMRTLVADPPSATDSDMKSIVRQAAAELERDLIGKALEETGGNITLAAKKLKISRKSLQAKIKEFGIAEVWRRG